MRLTAILTLLLLAVAAQAQPVTLTCFTVLPTNTPTITKTPTVTPTVGAATLTPTTAVSYALKGFVPAIGTARNVAVNASTGTAFVAGDEFGLSTVSYTSSPPAAIGGANPPFTGNWTATAGARAVVSSGASVTLLNVSTPSTPSTVGTISLPNNSFGAIAVDGSAANAYVTANDFSTSPTTVTMTVLSISGSPSVVTTRPISNGRDLTVVGSTLYMADCTAGLRIFDISTPAAPVQRSLTAMPGAACAVAVAVTNNFAYLAAGTSIYPFNVSNPSSPVAATPVALGVSHLAASGNRLYGIDLNNFRMLDVTTPSTPVLLNTSSSFGAQGVAAVSNRAFLTVPTAGLYILDVTTTPPTTVTNLYGVFSADSGVGGAGAIAAVGAGNSLKVVNATSPTQPVLANSFTVANTTFSKVAMSGFYAYVTANNLGNSTVAVDVINLQTPTAPSVVMQLPVTLGRDVRVLGSLLYVADCGTGLRLYNISNPASPSAVATVGLPGAPCALSVAPITNFAYVAAGSDIYIVNTTVPAASFVAGTVGASATALAAAGSNLYGLTLSTLSVWDVSNPGSPVLRNTGTNYGAQGITALGSNVFLAVPTASHSLGGGVFLLDASTVPPLLVRQITVPGTTHTVAVGGATTIYAGDPAGTVDVIQP